MNSRNPSKEEITLHHLVGRATEDLMPNRYYSLEIGDIALRQSSLRSLEHAFDRSLDQSGKAKAVLAFNETTRQLYPQSIHFPLDKLPVEASLHYTDTLGYIPIFSRYSQDETTSLAQLPALSQEGIMDILDVEQPPADDTVAYRLWLSELLARSNTWSLNEQLELPDTISESLISSLVLRNYIHIHKDGADTVRSVAHQTAIPTDGGDNIIMRTSIEVGSDSSYTTHIRTFKELGHQRPQDLFNPDIVWQHRESLPLDEDSFSPLVDMAHEAIEARQSLE